MLLVGVLAPLHAGGCQDAPISIHNITKGTCFLGKESEGGWEAAILAEEGDLLEFGIQGDGSLVCFFRYQRKDGRRLVLRRDADAPYKIFLNDRLIALTIEDDPAVGEWVRQCNPRELRHLRSIYFASEEADPSFLKKIAKARPHLGLVLDFEYADNVLSFFTPSWLMTGELEFSDELLPRLRRLELLYTGGDIENFDFLGKLPHLDTLIFEGGDSAPSILSTVTDKLRSLTLRGSEIPSLSALRFLKNLRNLHLVGCEIQDADTLPPFTRLRGVGFTDCKDLADASALQGLRSLEWVAFPPGTSQEEFARCLEANPRLQVVSIFGCENIQDLSPLERLPRLKGLVYDLPDEDEDLPSLPKLQNLEVLMFGDTEPTDHQLEQLQAAAPNAQVVAGGYCLGSGWILLVIPAVAALRLAVRWRKKGAGR
jgi:hypothetical protein